MRCRLPSSKSVVWSVQILAQLIASVCCNPIYFFNSVVKHVILKQTHRYVCALTRVLLPNTSKIRISMLYFLYWVILWGLNFMCRRFGTLFHLHRSVNTQPLKMEQTACSETSAYKIQTLRNYPE